METNNNFKWYVTRDNFLSKEECEEIINISDKSNKKINEQRYLDKVWKVMQLSNNLYYKFDVDGIQLQEVKYYDEDTFKEDNELHSDFAAGPDRTDTNTKLTSVVFLNDDYKGGELQVWGEKIESKQGRIVILPSFAGHKVNQFYDGNRYTLITVVKGNTFK